MRHVSLWLACLAVITVAGLAVQVVEHAWLAALAALAAVAGAYTLGRSHGGRRMARRALAAELRVREITGQDGERR